MEEELLKGLVCPWEDDDAVSCAEEDEREEERERGGFKRVQFLGGIDDDDTQRLEDLRWLEREVERVKRETAARERGLPVTDAPWDPLGPGASAVAPCRFHRLGAREAEQWCRARVMPQVDDRERVWQAFRVDLAEPGAEIVAASFVGVSQFVQEDMTRVLTNMVSGKPPRRLNDLERSSEFNKYALLEQVGHSWYRKRYDLSFFRFTLLSEETALLATRAWVAREIHKHEVQFIEEQNTWVQPGRVSNGLRGLNFWDTAASRFRLTWGVSLQHLRSILDENDSRCQNWTLQYFFIRIIKPRLEPGESYIDFLRRTKPESVSEDVDYFLSPGCNHCIWYSLIFGGGISLNTQIPRPIVKGDRFVYVDLFTSS